MIHLLILLIEAKLKYTIYQSWIGAAIAGAATLAGLYTGWRTNKQNMQSQSDQNQKDRDAQLAQWQRERDQNQKDFANQNAYNNPIQQMTRLRQAGLNPHLIYGKGADQSAAQIKSATANMSNQNAPQSNTSYVNDAIATGGNAAMNVYDMRVKQAQTDNLHTSNQLMAKEGILKDANTAKVMQDTARSKYDLNLAQGLRENVITAAQLNNDKMQQDISTSKTSQQFTLDANQRAQLSNSANVKKTIQEIVNMRQQNSTNKQQLTNLQIDQKAKEFDVEFKKLEKIRQDMGGSVSDPWYVRKLDALTRLLGQL